jgi:hypothetical protein
MYKQEIVGLILEIMSIQPHEDNWQLLTLDRELANLTKN